jgi:anti-anti-sigma factor
MQIETTSLTPVLHLVLSGRFDSESAASFEQMVTNNWSEGVRELRVTMTGVEYISSMGVRELVRAASSPAAPTHALPWLRPARGYARCCRFRGCSRGWWTSA